MLIMTTNHFFSFILFCFLSFFEYTIFLWFLWMWDCFYCLFLKFNCFLKFIFVFFRKIIKLLIFIFYKIKTSQNIYKHINKHQASTGTVFLNTTYSTSTSSIDFLPLSFKLKNYRLFLYIYLATTSTFSPLIPATISASRWRLHGSFLPRTWTPLSNLC